MSSEKPDPVVAEAVIAHAVVEQDHHVEPTMEDMAAFREEYANRVRRGNRVDTALLALFLLMVVFFVLLAYRTENTDKKLAHGLYDACKSRANTSQQFNLNREKFITQILAGPGVPKDPIEQIAFVQQLREGLLLPVEDCGPAPS